MAKLCGSSVSIPLFSEALNCRSTVTRSIADRCSTNLHYFSVFGALCSTYTATQQHGSNGQNGSSGDSGSVNWRLSASGLLAKWDKAKASLQVGWQQGFLKAHV